MRHQTFKRIEKAWRNRPTDHEFESWEQFLEVLSSLGEVDGDGSDFHYCPRWAEEPLGPDNIKLVEVVTDGCWDKVLHPAI
ncbi:hypothetical protein CEE69_16005 [Rhodopirellula bahusiensis]|uniref:Uncharacterized protein n=1 Tax=Rhodopirellula bahusiensis TaxID=2014065 RepID=A0A2G1W562_9BACT|nr:hypothetical protein CEE69_16005 [Rhodopirellula bahusiensis]